MRSDSARTRVCRAAPVRPIAARGARCDGHAGFYTRPFSTTTQQRRVRRNAQMLPTSTDVTVNVKTKIRNDCEALVVFVAEGAKVCGDASELLGGGQMRAVDRLIKAG